MGEIVAWFLDPAHLSGTGSIPQRLFEHIVLCAAALLTACVRGRMCIGHARCGTSNFNGLYG